jgi:hypothetical protein
MHVLHYNEEASRLKPTHTMTITTAAAVDAVHSPDLELARRSSALTVQETIPEGNIEAKITQLPPHRSHDPQHNLKRSDPFMFGSRYLDQGDDVFEFNAWDHVETDDAYKEYSEQQFAMQRASPVSDFDKSTYSYFSCSVLCSSWCPDDTQLCIVHLITSDDNIHPIVFRSHLTSSPTMSRFHHSACS